MAFIHPDRARRLEDANVPDERGFPVDGRAEHTLSTRKKNKRSCDEPGNEQRSTRGSEITAPDEYAKSARDQAKGQEAKLDNIRTPRPNTFDADRGKRPRVEVPCSQRRTSSRRYINNMQRRVYHLEMAKQLAPSYPDLADTEALRKIGQKLKRSSQAEHTHVFWHLRLDQRPRGLGHTEWKKRVLQEMGRLGLDDRFTDPHANKSSEDEVKVEVMGGEIKETVETPEDERRRKEMERMVADDGLDIDIYGDEETRKMYEPWIRSRMDRT